MQYGDGLFETIAFPNHSFQLHNHPFLTYHFARLQKGCQVLGLKFDQEKLLESIQYHRAQFESVIVKIMLTRDQTGRGYTPKTACTQVFIRAEPWKLAEDVSYRVKKWQPFIASQPLLAGIKHLNRLENVLASKEIEGATDEVILCDSHNHAIEGTKSNLFALLEEGWVTPRLDH